MKKPRLRVIGWNVQPVVMMDDGENLTPVDVQPQMIPASAWQAFKDGGDEKGLAHLRSQIEGSTTPRSGGSGRKSRSGGVAEPNA